MIYSADQYVSIYQIPKIINGYYRTGYLYQYNLDDEVIYPSPLYSTFLQENTITGNILRYKIYISPKTTHSSVITTLTGSSSLYLCIARLGQAPTGDYSTFEDIIPINTYNELLTTPCSQLQLRNNDCMIRNDGDLITVFESDVTVDIEADAGWLYVLLFKSETSEDDVSETECNSIVARVDFIEWILSYHAWQSNGDPSDTNTDLEYNRSTVIWFGTEDIDFPNGSKVSVSGRTILRSATVEFAKSVNFEQKSSFWAHCYLPNGFRIFNYNSNKIFGVGDLDTGSCVYVGYRTSILGDFISLRQGLQILAEEPFDEVILTNYVTLDINVVPEHIYLYVCGHLIIDLEDEPNESTNCVFLGNMCNCSEFIVASSDTRLMRMESNYPNAAGDMNTWVGSYGSINNPVAEYNSTIYTDSSTSEFHCNITSTLDTNYIIGGIRLCSSSRKIVSGLRVRHGIKTNDNIILSLPIQLEDVYLSSSSMWLSNPITFNNFTIEEISNMQIAIQSTPDV